MRGELLAPPPDPTSADELTPHEKNLLQVLLHLSQALPGSEAQAQRAARRLPPARAVPRTRMVRQAITGSRAPWQSICGILVAAPID